MYGYARVSIREPEDKNLDLQMERLVRAGCAMGNIRAEEASGAKDDRGGLLELLDLVVEGDTLVVTHIDRLSRGLTYGLQVIEAPPAFLAAWPSWTSITANLVTPAVGDHFEHVDLMCSYSRTLTQFRVNPVQLTGSTSVTKPSHCRVALARP